MNGLGASILTFLAVVVLFAPRRWALLAMMAGVLFLTQAQHVEWIGLHLFAMRFLEVAGFIRLIVRKEFSFFELNRVDYALLALYIYATVIFLLRSREGQAAQIGLAVDALCSYFLFRGLIGDIEDFRWFLRVFLILLVPYLMIVSVESRTGRNPFELLGATAEVMVREGRPRCMGSFRHPVLMGTLGASFLPLYIGLGFTRKDRLCAWVGIGACVGLVLLSNSGGPLSCAAVGLIGWLLWALRKKMFIVRRCLTGLIIILAIFMKAPVWYLLAKVSIITGGGGWHRSYLLDVAANNLGRWWLAGMPIKETAEWLPYLLGVTGGTDVTNQFIYFGIMAGLAAIALFVVLLTCSFSALGKALTTVRSHSHSDRQTEAMFWGLGCMLSVHIVNWFGISYFDQIYVVWFMQLAAISTLSQRCVENTGAGWSWKAVRGSTHERETYFSK